MKKSIDAPLQSVKKFSWQRAARKVQLVCKDESRTKQAFKDECDINNIVSKAMKAGELQGMINPPRYADVADAPRYHEALTLVVEAQAQFDALPSAVRKRFANDPANFLEFANDPSSAEEMIKLGLASPRPLPASPASPSSPGQGDPSPSAKGAPKGAQEG